MQENLSQITEKTLVVYVQNTQLAGALLAVNVALRKDPAFVYVRPLKKPAFVRWCFHPRSTDGMFKTVDLIKFWKRDIEFMSTQPNHPFAIAMMAVKNSHQMADHILTQKPYVMFRHPEHEGATIYLKEGSRKHKIAMSLNLTQL